MPNYASIYKKYFLFLFLLLSQLVATDSLFSQNIDSLSFKGAKKKIKEKIKKKASNKELKITGNVNVSCDYNFININPSNSVFDYRFAMNVMVDYRGIKIPIQYLYSNGRTISQTFGPNFKTPSFRNFGLSPKKGNTTLHLGNRSMNFSKYTYEGVRFTGVGVEHEGEYLDLKAFYGKLNYINQNELAFFNEIENDNKRAAYGLFAQYTLGNLKLGGILFKATDRILPDLQPMDLSPKQNVALEFNSDYSVSEDIAIEFSRTLSAYSPDIRDPRVDILTHSTAYNLLGLFEQKSSSTYNYTNLAAIRYKLDKYDFAIEYEDVDKDYRSLGTFIYDNNYRSMSFVNSGFIIEPITYNTSLGIRKTKETNNLDDIRNSLITRTNVTYKPSEKLSFTGTYSNINNTQKTYNRRLNSTSIDSLSLLQVNQTIGLNSSYLISKENGAILNLFVNYQKGRGIRGDSLQNNNNVKNINIGGVLTYNYKIHNLSFSSFFVKNITSNFNNKMYTLSLSDKVNFSDSHALELTTAYNRIMNSSINIDQLRLGCSYLWKTNFDSEFRAIFNFDVGNAESFLTPTRGVIGVEYKQNFGYVFFKNKENDTKDIK